MKTVIIGKLVTVAETEKKEAFSQQRIEVEVKEFDSTTGAEKSVKIFPITIFNKKITELNAIASKHARVAVTCYINSLRSEKDGKVFHNLALNAVELKEV
jgi:hypothetical protein